MYIWLVGVCAFVDVQITNYCTEEAEKEED
jgi:hypothetical protein